jgi:hypothetical protein
MDKKSNRKYLSKIEAWLQSFHAARGSRLILLPSLCCLTYFLGGTFDVCMYTVTTLFLLLGLEFALQILKKNSS